MKSKLFYSAVIFFLIGITILGYFVGSHFLHLFRQDATFITTKDVIEFKIVTPITFLLIGIKLAMEAEKKLHKHLH